MSSPGSRRSRFRRRASSNAAAIRADLARPTPGTDASEPGARRASCRTVPPADANRLPATESASLRAVPVPNRIARSSTAVNADGPKDSNLSLGRSAWLVSVTRSVAMGCNLADPQQPGVPNQRRVALGVAERAESLPSYAALPWHFLYFLPLPHGHGSLRPTFGPDRFVGFDLEVSEPSGPLVTARSTRDLAFATPGRSKSISEVSLTSDPAGGAGARLTCGPVAVAPEGGPAWT